MRIQETLLESRIRQSLRRMTHYIEDEADGLLCEGGDQVIITSLLPVDAVKTETALGQNNQLTGLSTQKAGSLRLWRPAGLTSSKSMRSLSSMCEGEAQCERNVGSPM
jgi:hypothetical protein